MRYTFPLAQVRRFLAEASVAWSKAPPEKCWGEVVGRQFYLVGDDGVYLMHNGKVKTLKPGERHFVVYANECNPKKQKFDIWWENKRMGFGGDDGAELIPAEVIERAVAGGWDVRLNVTAEGIGIVEPVH